MNYHIRRIQLFDLNGNNESGYHTTHTFLDGIVLENCDGSESDFFDRVLRVLKQRHDVSERWVEKPFILLVMGSECGLVSSEVLEEVEALLQEEFIESFDVLESMLDTNIKIYPQGYSFE